METEIYCRTAPRLHQLTIHTCVEGYEGLVCQPCRCPRVHRQTRCAFDEDYAREVSVMDVVLPLYKINRRAIG